MTETTPEFGQDNTIESSDLTIEETREELAKAYLTFLDQQKGGLIGTGAGIGVNLNPFQKSTIEYLVSETKGKEKGDFLKTIGKNIKKKLIEKIGMKGSGIEGMSFEYDKAKLDRVKAIIIANKDNKAQLENLIEQIASGVDIGAVEGNTSVSSESQEISPSTNVLPVATTYGALKVGENITQDEITYVETNAKEIVDHLRTKGDLSEIKEIRDKDGNVILKCRGKSPYVNSKAASDLIGLSLLYYKKTGKKFVLESAYRTIDHQKTLKEKNAATGTPTANPGYSGHNLGYSIDVSKESKNENNIGGVYGLQKIAKIFNFNSISSEDRHFDHKEFVDEYYNDKDARLPVAQKLDALFDDEQEYDQAA